MADLGKLIEELNEAKANYDAAEVREAQARSNCTDALNRLNKAQAAVDACMGELREKAPRRSDWAEKRRRGEPVDG
jgi:chromosome segregation ATPase